MLLVQHVYKSMSRCVDVPNPLLDALAHETSSNCTYSWHRVVVFCYVLDLFCLLGRSGTESTVTEATHWPIVPALDDRW
jgi:hypothetical protein